MKMPHYEQLFNEALVDEENRKEPTFEVVPPENSDVQIMRPLWRGRSDMQSNDLEAA